MMFLSLNFPPDTHTENCPYHLMRKLCKGIQCSTGGVACHLLQGSSIVTLYKLPEVTILFLHTMAFHMVVLAKIKLLSCGLSNWQLLALLLPFAMKLPFAFNIPVSLAEMIVSMRCFIFRLSRILFGNTLARRDQRWERAFRLLQERAIINSRSEMMWSDDDALNLSLMML